MEFTLPGRSGKSRDPIAGMEMNVANQGADWMTRHRSTVRPLRLGVIAWGLFAWAAVCGGSYALAVDVVVVCPPHLRGTLEPWLEFRRAEGLTIAICDVEPDADLQRARIMATADESTRYVLLVGGAPVIGTPCQTDRQIPTCYATSLVTVAWGSTPTLPSDFGYSDLNGDGNPNAAVGRLPVSSAEQLRGVVARILAYEQSGDFGLWRGDVQLTGGIGGFGKLVDAAIESVTRTVVTSMLPPETRTRVAYASPGHRFFPDGESFTNAVLQRYRSGSRFWVYAGHGWVNQLDRVPRTADGVPVLDGESVRQLQREASGAPIALMLACYTGAIDAAEPSLAEMMLLADGGPIAVFAGSRVTMPYGNTTAAVGLIDSVYRQRLPRIGDAWLSTLDQMNQDDESVEKSPARMIIDTLAALCSPAQTTLADERREHMRLFHLIGDPTLRLHHPQPLRLEVAQMERDDDLRLRLASPVAGKLTVCIDRPLGASLEGDPNDTTIATADVEIEIEELCELSISLPRMSRGPVIIRALVTGQTSWATAAATWNLR